jgi:hypothetical protein
MLNLRKAQGQWVLTSCQGQIGWNWGGKKPLSYLKDNPKKCRFEGRYGVMNVESHLENKLRTQYNRNSDYRSPRKGDREPGGLFRAPLHPHPKNFNPCFLQHHKTVPKILFPVLSHFRNLQISQRESDHVWVQFTTSPFSLGSWSLSIYSTKSLPLVSSPSAMTLWLGSQGLMSRTGKCLGRGSGCRTTTILSVIPSFPGFWGTQDLDVSEVHSWL